MTDPGFAAEAAAQRALLERDLAVEGYPSRSGATRRRAFEGAIVRVELVGTKLRKLHATKGWRERSLTVTK